MLIRAALEEDHDQWRELWNGYNRFYEATVPIEVTEHTWRRILSPSSPLVGRVAEHAGQLVGMTVSVIHEGTWAKTSTLYLEDLFVVPEARGGGIGRDLMDDVVVQAKALGCRCLYWHTRRDNAPARRLYDTFVLADDFVRYRMMLSEDAA